MSIKTLTDQNTYFPANSFVGFLGNIVYNDTGPSAVFTSQPRNMGTDQGIFIGWGQSTSTRYGRVTFVRSQSTVWMVDFQAVASVNPASGLYQGQFNGNGYQVVSTSNVLGGVQFVFNVGNIDSGAVSIHYS
jgi:hypothetical protein